MPIIDSFLGELDHESRNTARMLERVPDDNPQWTPHPKSMPIRKLAWHIAALPMRVKAMLGTSEFDVLTARPPDPPDDTASIVAAYQQNMTDLRAFLTTLDDETLKSSFTMKRGEQVMMTIPKVAVIRSILLNHTVHHRAQLGVYLRLLDVAVPAMYGTSADEA
jgi:uncharacterized damage-inducible protein DinB